MLLPQPINYWEKKEKEKLGPPLPYKFILTKSLLLFSSPYDLILSLSHHVLTLSDWVLECQWTNPKEQNHVVYKRNPLLGEHFPAGNNAPIQTLLYFKPLFFSPLQSIDLIWRQCQSRERCNTCSFPAASVAVQP